MIKRLIFDLDNTLIDWKNEYWETTLKNVFRDLNINESRELKNIVIQSVDNYESRNEYFNKQKMLDDINDNLEKKLPIEFIELCLKYLEKCVPQEADKNLIETLEYLNNKYELVVLTNWFEYQQAKRLENLGILKYFKKVYAPENFKMKPNSESYIVAVENNKPIECAMIGDNINTDIDGAINVGINAIYYNKNKKLDLDKNKNGYITINKLKNLMDIL